MPTSSRELWQWVRTQPMLDLQSAYLDVASGGPTLRASMAAEYRAREVQSIGLASAACAADMKVINDKAAFPEGPIFLDGKLYYVEYGGNTIDIWDGKTNTVLWKSDGCGPIVLKKSGVEAAVKH